jgi:hypothetical protein
VVDYTIRPPKEKNARRHAAQNGVQVSISASQEGAIANCQRQSEPRSRDFAAALIIAQRGFCGVLRPEVE